MKCTSRGVARRGIEALLVAVVMAAWLVIAPPFASASTSAPTGASTTVVDEANWILGAQLPDGAIAVWPDRPVLRLIWPYLANEAASGLARATEVTGDPTYAAHAWSYLAWYAQAEDPATGFVTDYTIQNGTTPVSNGHYDSTDAYAGTYLAAVWDTYSATQDLTHLQALAGGVAGAIDAIAATQQPNGLTWATPSWHVAYLMDNAQALAGLEAGAAIERALGNATLAGSTASRATSMQDGIDSLWNPSTNAYNWALQQDGWQHPTSWGNLYPDALEQMSAVEWGAVPAKRVSGLLNSFGAAHPAWDDPTASDNYLSGASVVTQAVGYWPLAAIAYDVGSQTSTAASKLSNILSAAAAKNYGWPFTTGDAGEAIIAASGTGILDPISSPHKHSGAGSHTASTHLAATTRHSGGARAGGGRQHNSRGTKHPAPKLNRSSAVPKRATGAHSSAGTSLTALRLGNSFDPGRLPPSSGLGVLPLVVGPAASGAALTSGLWFMRGRRRRRLLLAHVDRTPARGRSTPS